MIPDSGVPAGLNIEAVIRQLETEFAPKIPPDDPLRRDLRGFQLLYEAAFRENARIVREGTLEILAEYHGEFDAAAAEKVEAVNEEFLRSAEQAIDTVNKSKNEANQVLIGFLVEMRQVVEEMKAHHRASIWRERVYGLFLASALLLGGFVFGLAYHGSH